MPFVPLPPAITTFMQRGWLWAFLASAAVGAVAAAIVAAVVPAPYRAEATFVVSGPAPTRELQLTYVDLALSPPVLERASTRSGIPVARFEHDVRIVPAPQSLVIRVSATADSRSQAVAMANAMTDALPSYLAEAGLDDDRSLRVARDADTAGRVSSPFIASVVLGAVAGIAVCWIASRLGLTQSGPTPRSESNLSLIALAPRVKSDDSGITRENSVPGGHLDL